MRHGNYSNKIKKYGNIDTILLITEILFKIIKTMMKMKMKNNVIIIKWQEACDSNDNSDGDELLDIKEDTTLCFEDTDDISQKWYSI